jgi:hypothetical protein
VNDCEVSGYMRVLGGVLESVCVCLSELTLLDAGSLCRGQEHLEKVLAYQSGRHGKESLCLQGADPSRGNEVGLQLSQSPPCSRSRGKYSYHSLCVNVCVLLRGVCCVASFAPAGFVGYSSLSPLECFCLSSRFTLIWNASVSRWRARMISISSSE